MTPINAPSVLVVGGGLSGIVLSHELASRGWQVTLLERSGRLGGKAGSELRNGRLVEQAITFSVVSQPVVYLLPTLDDK
jgi:phytoene dehydrogenase-like protein